MDVIEPLNTVQFTFTSSIAPDSAPTLLITGIDSSVTSITATASDTTNYYALYTAVQSEGVYIGKWIAQKTVSGSVYNFNKAFLFNVKMTRGSY